MGRVEDSRQHRALSRRGCRPLEAGRGRGASPLSPVLSPASWRGAISNGGRLLGLHWSLLIRHLKLRVAASRSGAQIPPGALVPGDDSLHRNQRRALDLSRKHGPVFKLINDNQWTTCLIGLDRGRRLLTEHEAALPGVTLNLEPLFPGGALRGMEGETHKTYRRGLVQALQATPLSAHATNIRESVDRTLSTLAEDEAGGDEIRRALRDGMSTIMLGVIFGLTPRSPRYAAMLSAYRRFGPTVPVYRVEEAHRRAFMELQELARAHAEEIRAAPAFATPSMLRHMVTAGTLDETALGNLINLFESSHFDVYSLWHWLLWYLAREPGIKSRLRALPEGSEDSNRLLEAIVMETLRLDQSEVLLRHATSDIRFDGFFIPRGTTVRVCLWESHKDERIFPDPFRFNPDRFLSRTHDIEEFAPFGLDKRRCIGMEVIFAASTVLVERFLRDYDAEIVADGPPVRGAYHWEPAPRFALRATRRTEGPKDRKT